MRPVLKIGVRSQESGVKGEEFSSFVVSESSWGSLAEVGKREKAKGEREPKTSFSFFLPKTALKSQLLYQR
jgi:hypothetical protein